MLKKPWGKYILSALAIIAGGFILLNIAFAVFGLIGAILEVIARFAKGGFEIFGPTALIAGVLLFGFITWIVFRTKLPVLFKAIYLMVPAAIILVILGILFYRWPIVTFIAGPILVLTTLFIFYKTRQPWQYYFSVIAISLTLMIGALFGMEI
jgi:hypothetical protein